MAVFSWVSSKENLKCSISNEKAPFETSFRENKLGNREKQSEGMVF